jgi:uncharacterized protein YkwD
MRRHLRWLPVLLLATALLGCGGGGGGGSSSAGGGGGSGGGTVVTGTKAEQYNLDRINQFRASVGAAPLVLDGLLDDFATKGSQQLMADHTPHAHFQQAANDGSLWTSGFVAAAGENQGDPNGWPPRSSVQAQIEEILQAMWNEGPGTGAAHGHYNNIVNPAFHRLGVGLVLDGSGRLYFTNDFSG